MRILLVSPTFDEETFIEMLGLKCPPIGLAYIASYLRENGHDVDILDMASLELGKEDLRKKLLKFNPEVVGAYSTAFNDALEVLETSKNVSEDIFTLIGGPHASLVPERIVRQNDFVDVVIRGEGEITTAKVLDSLANNTSLGEINGIAYKKGKDGEVKRTKRREVVEDIDELPSPARDLLPNEEYTFFGNLKINTIISSRGCRENCNYCSVPLMYGGKWRPRNPSEVADEVQEIEEKYDPDLILFVDDNLDVDRERTEKICREIIKRNIETPWGIQSSVVHTDKEHLDKLWEAGCRMISYNIETTSEKAIEKNGRDMNKREIASHVKSCREKGMMVVAHAVMGLPGEDKSDVEETIEFIKKIKPHYAFYYLPTPYPGTKFHETAKKEGLIEENELNNYTPNNGVISTRKISAEEAEELNHKAWKEFYFDIGIIKSNAVTTYKLIREGAVDIKKIPSIFKHLIKIGYKLIKL